jgi:CHAT domain-containing protein
MPRTWIPWLAPLLLLLIGLPRAYAFQKHDMPPGQPTTLEEARANLAKVEAAHPGNTLELADALDLLVQFELDDQKASDETLALAKRQLAVAEAAAGTRTRNYVSSLSNLSEVYVTLSRPAEGRPYAERAFKISQKEFPDDEEGINAADELAYVCNALGDFPCALRASEASIAIDRKPGPEHPWDLAVALNNLSDLKERMNDEPGAGAAIEEALAVGMKARPDDPHIGVFENNAGSHYLRTQQFDLALAHLNRAIELFARFYGVDSSYELKAQSSLADLYNRTGQFPLAWKNYEIGLGNKYLTVDERAELQSVFARSLASGGDLPRAIEEGLAAARIGRENFVLQARTLPERQALAYDRRRPRGLDTALSVLTRHPELPSADIYQEVVRSRALVADEMARRQKNLNAGQDPAIAGLLKDLNQARADLLAVEQGTPGKPGDSEAIAQATSKMEEIERSLAERSAAVRNDDRLSAVSLDDVRRNLPARSVLVSYVAFSRRAVQAVDAVHASAPAYVAFVLHPDSDRIRVFDLGAAKPIEDLVTRLRATADAEAHSGGLGSIRNERGYREAGEALRKLVWDPLRGELDGANLALVVPDGSLNLFPFGGLPDGKGYLVEHGPVIHLLSSERDLIPSPGQPKKTGLLAIGSPQFDLQGGSHPPAALRGEDVACNEFRQLDFHPLPGTAEEVNDINSSWRRWNGTEPSALVTGAEATRARFLEDAPHSRVLHVATHAFLLDRRCGDDNPLLHAGLVFAGARNGRASAILTAQQIASLDLNGVEWAVLSACNTGNGLMLDGEGVLSLQRAFRVAGARSVVMALWPVDDDVTRHFMHELYAERLGRHATTADAVWNSTRMLLLERRAAGKSTHPWYWAGFVGSGGWE